METKSKGKAEGVMPGFYRGVWQGTNVTLYAGATNGRDVRVAVETNGADAMPVIVFVGSNLECQVYADLTEINMKDRVSDEPITPAYLRDLANVRRHRIGPLVAAINAELIERAAEMEPGSVVRIDVEKMTGGNAPSEESLNLAVASFNKAGFDMKVVRAPAGTDDGQCPPDMKTHIEVKQ